MKKLSITLRITLWYALLMLLIVALVLAFMVAVSGSVATNAARDRLFSVVDVNMEEVEYDNDGLDVDDDFDFYKNGVTSLVYAQDLARLAGQPPQGFPEDTPFADGGAQEVSFGGEQYLVYDRLVTSKKHPDLWVRGVLPLDAVSGVAGPLLRVALFALPFLVVLAAVGGFFITRRAFRPVRAITQTVESITEGRDLSRRIVTGEGRDEIHALAGTFNDMLARLESAFEAERQFVSDVSHELRTPVSVILAQCEYALEQPEEGADALGVVRRQADRMHQLIARLLSITRMEQAAYRADLRETDVSALVSALSEDAVVLAPEGVALRLDISPGIRARVDAPLFSRLFENLVQNAYKYGGRRVEVSLWAENDKACLRVADDGIGIPPEEQPKVWRRFYQANPARTAGEAGSLGLGLSIVRQIALLHRGEVTLRSVPGQGSAFTFSFARLP